MYLIEKIYLKNLFILTFTSRESRFFEGGGGRGERRERERRGREGDKFCASRSFPDHQQWSFPIKRWKSTRHGSQEGRRHRCLSSELTSFAPKATIRAVTPVKWHIHQKCRPARLDASLDIGRLAGSHYLNCKTIQLMNVIANCIDDFNAMKKCLKFNQVKQNYKW